MHRNLCGSSAILQLLATAVFLLSDGVIPSLHAQPPVPDSVTVPPAPEPLTVVPLTVESPVQQLHHGFWIVRSHCSQQSFDTCKPAFRPTVRRFDCGAGYSDVPFADMRQKLIPGVPICIFIHGSFVTQEELGQESINTWNWVRRGRPDKPVQMIAFSWPSDSSIDSTIQLDTVLLGRRAARNGHYLLDLINCLPEESPVCLIGHSHGARVVVSALHLRAGGCVQGVRHPNPCFTNRPIRAVLVAAAVDHHWLNPDQRYNRAVCGAQCLLNLRNQHDYALKAYFFRRPFSKRALGQSGFTDTDQKKLRPQAHRLCERDVTNIIGHGHNWPLYHSKPNLSVLVSNYVFFPDVPRPTR